MYELRKTVSPAVYLELDFHDTVNGAKWLIDNKKQIANTLFDVIAEIFQLSCEDVTQNYTFYCPHCGKKLEVV